MSTSLACTRSVTLAVLLAGNAVAGELPPPPASMEAVADAPLYLELVVNQMSSASVVLVHQRAGRLYMATADLQAAGVQLPGQPGPELALDAIDGLHSEYDSQNQRLLVQVPAAWLPNQRIGERSLGPAGEALSSFGALLNYDAYFNDTDEGGTYLAAWNELRVFDSWGTFSTTGQWRQRLGGQATKAPRKVFGGTTPPGATPTRRAC